MPYEGLTPVEQSLVDHVNRGEWLNLAADGEVSKKAAMRSWGDSRICQAAVIRDILRGRLAPHPDSHGLRLRAARITGRLDLENLSTQVKFELQDCLLEEGFVARDAHLATVILTGCQLEHPTEPPLDAARLTCSVFGLRNTTIIGHTKVAAVMLGGAHIGGSLDCEGSELRNDTGPALVADGLQVSQSIFLRRGFTATGVGENGAVRLPSAHIDVQLDFDGAKLRNDSGPALIADSLKVSQDMHLRGAFTATGAGEYGAVRLRGAHIGGQLDFDGAKLRNHSGPALIADSLEVSQDMHLHGGFIATAVGQDGAVNLRGAHIGGQLYIDGAELRSDAAPALTAVGLQVDQDMHLHGGFTGAGENGAVHLRGAHIGGQLDLDGAKLRNDSGPALAAEGLQVGHDMYLRGGFIAIGGDDMAVDLTSTQVDGTLVFDLDPEQLADAANSHRWLAVDGLTYAGVPKSISVQDWLALLRNATCSYAAQPYQQLAAGYRALGDERQTREILMAQRDDQLTRTHPRWPEKLWGKITKVTLGYGYQPWRALLFLTAVVAMSCLLAVALGSHGALTQTEMTATPGQPCTALQQVSAGLDLNLPVGTSAARAECNLTKNSNSATAAWLAAAGWVLQLLAWAFAALFIAGFTSAVRKT